MAAVPAPRSIVFAYGSSSVTMPLDRAPTPEEFVAFRAHHARIVDDPESHVDKILDAWNASRPTRNAASRPIRSAKKFSILNSRDRETVLSVCLTIFLAAFITYAILYHTTEFPTIKV